MNIEQAARLARLASALGPLPELTEAEQRVRQLLVRHAEQERATPLAREAAAAIARVTARADMQSPARSEAAELLRKLERAQGPAARAQEQASRRESARLTVLIGGR